MSSDLIAIGASWCGYSQKQKAALERDCGQQGGTWDSESTTCTLEDNKKIGIIMCDENKDAEVCQAVQGQVQGYPTWFESNDEGSLRPLTKTIPAQQRTVHYVPEICSLPSMKGAPQCQ